MKLYLLPTKQHPLLSQHGHKVYQLNLKTNSYQNVLIHRITYTVYYHQFQFTLLEITHHTTIYLYKEN